MKITTIILGLVLSSFANADCVPQLISTGNVQIQKDMFSDNSCYISIHPMSVSNMVYRDYMATDSGLLMIFNSYGDGPSSTTTGAREFYFFPRSRSVNFSVDPRSKDVSILASNGDEFIFDARTAQLKSMGLGKVKLDHSINPDNRGGVEIDSYKGLYLDVGFALGHSPSTEADRTITFHSSTGKTCDLKVKDIFINLEADPAVRFSDEELVSYLSKNCSNW